MLLGCAIRQKRRLDNMVYITIEQVIQYDDLGEYLYVDIDGEIFTLKFDEVVFVKQVKK